MDKVTARRAEVQLVDLDEGLHHLLDIATRLCASGFRPGLPPTLEARTVVIDARACTHMHCPRCGVVGMRYQPYYRPHGDGFAYRALAQCPRCGSVEEV